MTGLLGAEDLSATTNTLIYTGLTGNVATVTINITNRNAVPVNIRIAVIGGLISTVSNKNYIEYDVEVCENGVIERSGVVIGPDQTIMAYSDTANVSCQVWGWEEPV